MSEARKRLDWEEMFKLSMDPEKARRYRAEAKPEKEDTCSMCGNFCAVKNTNRILDGEIVTIFDECCFYKSRISTCLIVEIRLFIYYIFIAKYLFTITSSYLT